MTRQFQSILKLASLFLASVLLLGCASSPSLPAFQPASSQSVFVRWQRSNVSLTCEGVFARSADGAVLLRLYKQSPSPLLELRLQPDSFLAAKGSLAGPGWSGPSSRAPAPLAIWVSLLTTLQHADALPIGDREIHTASAHLAYTKLGDSLKSLSVSSTDSPETVSLLVR